MINNNFYNRFILSEQGLNFILEVNNTSISTGVDDGPRYHYGNKKTYEEKTKKIAERIGYKVINYLINDKEFEVHSSTEPPNGPPMAVSFFPAGNPGNELFGTNYLPDIKEHPAFIKYAKWVKKVAMKAGWYFVDFVDAELSKQKKPVKEFD